jgi:uncharacterized membrane protein YphA (DoxX/SURF4 family)
METINLKDALSPTVNILRATYGILPIVAGLDKFTNLLVDWEKYLNPTLVSVLPFSPAVFMMIVGVIEIIAGIIVLSKPTVGGIIVGLWLIFIAMTLIVGLMFLDVAVRDIVMAIGAFSLARLAKINQLLLPGVSPA